MKAEGSLPHSQQPATCPYSQPDRSSPCPHHISRTWVLILSDHLRLGLTCGRLPPYVLQVPPISVFLIWSPDWHLGRRTEHKAPRYVVFSNPLHRKNLITLRTSHKTLRNRQIVRRSTDRRIRLRCLGPVTHWGSDISPKKGIPDRCMSVFACVSVCAERPPTAYSSQWSYFAWNSINSKTGNLRITQHWGAFAKPLLP